MLQFLKNILPTSSNITTLRRIIPSGALQRDIIIDILLPPFYRSTTSYPIILFNDGQDFSALDMEATLRSLYKSKLINKAIIIGIHANENRLREYGVSYRPDYAHRGDLAAAHATFVTAELLPFLRKQFSISRRVKDISIAGFSLGGLSAFDIAWQHSHLFSRVGVFSGALWWRSQPFDENDPDSNRIIHDVVSQDTYRKGLQFWFQTGTHDENSDRNNNGVIDAIDDTLDLINRLREKGYTNEDLTYVEIEEGEHNPQTWGRAMLAFLIWAIGK